MGGGWYLGFTELPKICGNLRIKTLLKTISTEIPAMQQSRNYNEEPDQNACLYFYQQYFSF